MLFERLLTTLAPTAPTSRLQQGLKRRLKDEGGAYTIEFLGSFVALAITILIVLQIIIVFLNSVLINHALGLASTEASARGGVDPTVVALFNSKLPTGIKQYCTQEALGGCLTDPSRDSTTDIVPGSNERVNADMMTLDVEYYQPISFLGFLGGDPGIMMHRSVKVASQSAQED